jgi:hypothetical protein
VTILIPVWESTKLDCGQTYIDWPKGCEVPRKLHALKTTCHFYLMCVLVYAVHSSEFNTCLELFFDALIWRAKSADELILLHDSFLKCR